MKRTIATMTAVLALLLFSVAVLAQDGEQTRAYVVERGDTLGGIAKRFYGKSSLGSRLWRANKNLVAHPNRLTPGDTIYLFPESTLNLRVAVEVPPKPEEIDSEYPPNDQYERNDMLKTSFPKYFTFLSDLRESADTPTTRIKVKRMQNQKIPVNDPDSDVTFREITTTIDDYFEVREVGEIIASTERGATIYDDGFSSVQPGRLLLSTSDQVIVRFTTDLAKVLDSDTHEESDPYFRTFPIYGVGAAVQEPNRSRSDYGDTLGKLMRYKGTLTVVARVEGPTPVKPSASRRAKRRDAVGLDLEPVTYVAKITYSEDTIDLADKILVFVKLDPGPERRLDPPYVEEAGSYVSPGK